MTVTWRHWVILAAFVLAGCGAAPTAVNNGASMTPVRPSQTSPVDQPMPASTPTETSSSPIIYPSGTPQGEGIPQAPASSTSISPSLLQEARVDAARRFRVTPDAVTVQQIDPVVWPNEQLGCEGRNMEGGTPTPGFMILLRANNQTVEYHASQIRVIWCNGQRS